MAVPNRLTGSLPVSIVVHLAALVLILVIPLTAEVALPVPASGIDAYMRAVPAPPPPAPIPRVTVHRTTDPTHAPTVAPSSITPERDAHPPQGVDKGGVDLGPPTPGTPFGAMGTAAPTIDVPPPAAAPAKPAAPVRAGELVQSPRKTADVRPVYPEIARAAHVQGTVVLEAVLDRSGRVSQLRILKSVPLLDQAAIAAVRQWQYTPSTLHGVPVEVLMTITVTFTLQE